MQENQAPPRVGRETLVAREAAVLARLAAVHTELLAPPVVDGDRVVIRWRFTFTPKDGDPFPMEALAWQTWRGEKVATETLFYNPAQMRPRPGS